MHPRQGCNTDNHKHVTLHNPANPNAIHNPPAISPQFLYETAGVYRTRRGEPAVPSSYRARIAPLSRIAPGLQSSRNRDRTDAQRQTGTGTHQSRATTHKRSHEAPQTLRHAQFSCLRLRHPNPTNPKSLRNPLAIPSEVLAEGYKELEKRIVIEILNNPVVL